MWHDGGVYGYYTYLVYFPGEDVAVAVIANAYPGPPAGDGASIALAVAKAALNTQ